MNTEQFLLIKLAEEASEIAQIALKAAQFGSDEIMPGIVATNRDRIHLELNDLLGVVEELNDRVKFDFEPNPTLMSLKREKIRRYERYSRELGKVADDPVLNDEVDPCPHCGSKKCTGVWDGNGNFTGSCAGCGVVRLRIGIL